MSSDKVNIEHTVDLEQDDPNSYKTAEEHSRELAERAQVTDDDVVEFISDIAEASAFASMKLAERNHHGRSTNEKFLLDEQVFSDFRAYYKKHARSDAKLNFSSEDMARVLSVVRAFHLETRDNLSKVMDAVGENVKAKLLSSKYQEGACTFMIEISGVS